MSTIDDVPNVINGGTLPIETDIPKSIINSKEKAKEYLEKAIILNNSSDQFIEEALDLTSKAVECDPRLVDAWIELSECQFRKPDIDKAIASLEKGLVFAETEDKIHQVILRKLSAYLRQQNFDKQEQKIATFLRSVELAKQALKADLDDAENYYNLAKAYMCLFFATECVDYQLIILSKTAYQKALKICEHGKQDRMLTENPHRRHLSSTKPLLEQSDFLFNYSTVLLYCQEFENSLNLLRLAIKLDPEWNEPKKVEESMVDYVKQTYSMYEELKKNSKKIAKRYNKLIEPLKDLKRIETIIELDQQRMMKSTDLKVEHCTISELMERDITSRGQDSGAVKLLHLKLINMVNYNQSMYLTFMALDQNYIPIVITIYNLAVSTSPGPRDVVTIVNPKIEKVPVNNLVANQDQCLIYDRINVREFRDFYVNGFWIKNDQVAKPQFSVSIMP